VPLFEPTFDPRRLREVRFVAVEERRDEDESRPRHVQVRLDPDQQADLALANNQDASVADVARRTPSHMPASSAGPDDHWPPWRAKTRHDR
jgi:hypothetical protein